MPGHPPPPPDPALGPEKGGFRPPASKTFSSAAGLIRSCEAARPVAANCRLNRDTSAPTIR
ncbi:hypothetical protein, partial [Nocardia brasiliensis]|uniref:hypothetical protein n=1 Tax=Nocardia brasiliensis TaxID=37326 RepID=UPI0024587F6B